MLDYFQKKEELKRIRKKKLELKKALKKKYKRIFTPEELEASEPQPELGFDLQIISEVLSRLSDYKRTIEYGYHDDKNFELSNLYITQTRSK